VRAQGICSIADSTLHGDAHSSCILSIIFTFSETNPVPATAALFIKTPLTAQESATEKDSLLVCDTRYRPVPAATTKNFRSYAGRPSTGYGQFDPALNAVWKHL
jgi:hypothetical protein